MKRTVTLLLSLVLLLSIPMISLSDASNWTGEVIAHQVTFRSEPKSNGKSLGTIKNGTTVVILDDNHNGWFHIQHDGKEGYVMDEYVVENADHMILLASTPVYAFPHSDKRVGSLASYTRLTVIDEYDGYYVVNLREASGFIRKKNLNAYLDSESSSATIKGTVQIDKEDTTPRIGPSSNVAAATHDVYKGEQYHFVGMDGEWYIIIVDGHFGFIWQNTCHEI